MQGWILGGRYRVLDRLATGGMAEVFRAHDELLDRDVAVKVFRSAPEADDGYGPERRELELHSLAQLSHPNLITLFDGSVAGDAPAYLVLELVTGPDLATRLRSDGPMPDSEARLLGAQLADALAYVHAHGMVHRDVKPANILLGSDLGPDGPFRARLSDFGIVRMLDGHRMTSASLTLGTACYLSPEQARGADVEPAADIYSLGLVLIEVLTGRRCFDLPVMEALSARLAGPPPIPPGLADPWPELLEAMTALDPARRPTAAEVARALRSASVPALAGASLVGAAGVGGAGADAAEVTDPGLTGGLAPAVLLGDAAEPVPTGAAAAALISGPLASAEHTAPLPVQRRGAGSWWLFGLAALVLATIVASAGYLLLGGTAKSPAEDRPQAPTSEPHKHRSSAVRKSSSVHRVAPVPTSTPTLTKSRSSTAAPPHAVRTSAARTSAVVSTSATPTPTPTVTSTTTTPTPTPTTSSVVQSTAAASSSSAAA